MKLRALAAAVVAALAGIAYANTQAVPTSFKTELFLGYHNLGTGPIRAASTADTVKAALYFASATINASTTVYTTTGEATGTGYTAGGVTVTNGTAPTSSGTTAFWTPSASLSWTTVSIAAFDTVLFYNSTQGNRAMSVNTFTSQTVSSGNFSITMPTNAAGTALLNLA